jgi:predicted nuclease of predicted toxin-antitoxin system
MSRPKFLANHDLDAAIVRGVRRKEPSAEIVQLRELSMERASDSEILEYAAGEGFIFVSHDVNTMSGHAYARVEAGRPMSGVFLVRQGDPMGPVIEDLRLIWAVSDAEDWTDRVTHLPLPPGAF